MPNIYDFHANPNQHYPTVYTFRAGRIVNAKRPVNPQQPAVSLSSYVYSSTVNTTVQPDATVNSQHRNVQYHYLNNQNAPSSYRHC